MKYLTTQNTEGFNEIQLATLNNWIDNRLKDAETVDPNYENIVQSTCERALNMYQNIISEERAWTNKKRLERAGRFGLFPKSNRGE